MYALRRMTRSVLTDKVRVIICYCIKSLPMHTIIHRRRNIRQSIKSHDRKSVTDIRKQRMSVLPDLWHRNEVLCFLLRSHAISIRGN